MRSACRHFAKRLRRADAEARRLRQTAGRTDPEIEGKDAGKRRDRRRYRRRTENPRRSRRFDAHGARARRAGRRDQLAHRRSAAGGFRRPDIRPLLEHPEPASVGERHSRDAGRRQGFRRSPWQLGRRRRQARVRRAMARLRGPLAGARGPCGADTLDRAARHRPRSRRRRAEQIAPRDRRALDCAGARLPADPRLDRPFLRA